MSKKVKQVATLIIAEGKETTKLSGGYDLYTGIAPVKIVAVNPNQKELEALGITREVPEFISKDEAGVSSVRLDFWLRTVKEDVGVEVLTRTSYYIKDKLRTNRDGSKVQVVNQYGEFTWTDSKTPTVLPENQKWFSTEGIRPAYEGEQAVTMLLKAFLGIPGLTFRKADGSAGIIEDPSKALCQLEKIKDYFKGDISEIKNPIMDKPDNMVKFLFGVKTTEDNKSYQDVFRELPLKYNNLRVTRLEKEVTDRQQNGGYPSTNFGQAPYKFGKYVVSATNLEAEAITPEEVPSDAWYLGD